MGSSEASWSAESQAGLGTDALCTAAGLVDDCSVLLGAFDNVTGALGFTVKKLRIRSAPALC